MTQLADLFPPADLQAEIDAVFRQVQDDFASTLALALAGHPIELGLCGCGCGAETPLAIATSRHYPPGTPTRYIPSHSLTSSPP